MKINIPVYSDQELTPRAAEVIRAIVDSAYPEHEISFRQEIYNGEKALVFGRAPDAQNSMGIEWVYTYSIAQIMSKPNAASVLTAALRFFIDEPDPIPFETPLHFFMPSTLRQSFDFNLPVAIDIETDGGLGDTETPEEVNVISVAFYQPGLPPFVMVSEYFSDKSIPLSTFQIDGLRELLPQFKYPIYHNGKFDTRVLNRVLGVTLPVWFDTMLAHHVINHGAGDHKLKTLARRYLGAPEWEADLGSYLLKGGHYERIPQSKLVEYNGWDVYWTYKLYEFLAPQIAADEDFQKTFNFELMAADFLLKVEKVGIPFDSEYAGRYGAELYNEQGRVSEDLEKLVGYKVNPNSPKQVKELYLVGGYQLAKTDETTLLEMYDDFNSGYQQVTDLILEYRKLGKIRGTYAHGWNRVSRNGRVHPTFHVHGTTTGRLSSSNPNSQNIPRAKEIRKLVTITY